MFECYMTPDVAAPEIVLHWRTSRPFRSLFDLKTIQENAAGEHQRHHHQNLPLQATLGLFAALP
jgi:hypothetical protein